MIKIEQGSTTKVVTRGAYESFYKPLGYHVIVDATIKQGQQITKEKPISHENLKSTKVDKEIRKSQKVEEIKKR